MTKAESIETFRDFKQYVKEIIQDTNSSVEERTGNNLMVRVMNDRKELVCMLYFYEDGNVFMAGFGFPLKRTIPQMVQLINSLLEK